MAGCLALAALLGACATTPQVDPVITSTLASHGVTGGTYQKVSNAQRLDFEDIRTLAANGVPSRMIISYLQSTEAIYNFSPQRMQQLRAAGASQQLLNYLQETQGFYGHPSHPSHVASRPLPEYLDTPLYQDEQPFAYNAPEMDYWYDSAYEESLYSPFSFNGD